MHHRTGDGLFPGAGGGAVSAQARSTLRFMPARDLAPGEWSVLALLCERPSHGWALARELSREGELGEVWRMSRPLVYRALDLLVERELVTEVGQERGDRGPQRMLFRATESGQFAVRGWLAEPVDHIRDARTVLLLKLVLSARAGVEPTPLLLAQHEIVARVCVTLEQLYEHASESARILARFRLESARAVLRFVDGTLES